MVTIGHTVLLLVSLAFFHNRRSCEALARIKPLPRKDPFSVEASYKQPYILGSDESGVGCIAGPVVCVTCCVLHPKIMMAQCDIEIRDGKSMTLVQCREIRDYVERNPDIVRFSMKQRSNQDIDERGVHRCVQEGFEETILSLVGDLSMELNTTVFDHRQHFYSIVDGHRSPSFVDFTSRPWKQADSMVFTVAVAGCIARSIHTEIMLEHQARIQPEFKWDGGYPTQAHLQSLATHGPTEFHRTSCKPVQLHRRTAMSLLLLPLLITGPSHAMVRERGMLLPERGEVAASVPTEWSDIEEVQEPLHRLDDSVDSIFYRENRFVEHIDSTAVDSLRTYMASIVDNTKSVLDVGASWTSHLETTGLESVLDRNVVGIGMNANELSANAILTKRIVQDLNQTPQLPFNGKVFDIVLCQLTIDYLTKPTSVCKEMRRVLKVQGTAHVIFSNRLFLQKAVDNWTGRDDLEHIETVASYLHYSGFRDIEAQDLSIRNKRGSIIGDPLYVVRGVA